MWLMSIVATRISNHLPTPKSLSGQILKSHFMQPKCLSHCKPGLIGFELFDTNSEMLPFSYKSLATIDGHGKIPLLLSIWSRAQPSKRLIVLSYSYLHIC